MVKKPPTAYRCYRMIWTGLDWLYPPTCGGCGLPGSRWCEDCRSKVETLPKTVCRHCGEIIKTEGICDNCRRCLPAFSGMRSWGLFTGPLRQAMHRLKYERDLALGEVLALPLIQMAADLDLAVDVVTAVPIGIARRRERGYNQATMLALPIALGIGRPYRGKALTKIKEVRSQVGLSVIERRQNVSRVFRADPKIAAGKNILVVDDVTTSGATMDACAQALLSAGAHQVFGLTLARAVLDSA